MTRMDGTILLPLKRAEVNIKSCQAFFEGDSIGFSVRDRCMSDLDSSSAIITLEYDRFKNL